MAAMGEFRQCLCGVWRNSATAADNNHGYRLGNQCAAVQPGRDRRRSGRPGGTVTFTSGGVRCQTSIGPTAWRPLRPRRLSSTLLSPQATQATSTTLPRNPRQLRLQRRGGAVLAGVNLPPSPLLPINTRPSRSTLGPSMTLPTPLCWVAWELPQLRDLHLYSFAGEARKWHGYRRGGCGYGQSPGRRSGDKRLAGLPSRHLPLLLTSWAPRWPLAAKGRTNLAQHAGYADSFLP